MEHKLRRVLDNPFLKQNPFRQHESFFSIPKSHHNQSSSLPKQNHNYSYLSANIQPERRPATPTVNASFKGDSKCLKKASNPFFRKNLLTQNKENDVDYFETVQINLKTESIKIDKPQFLKNNVQDANQNTNIYKNLAHNPPGNSKNFISLDSRYNSQEKQKRGGDQEMMSKVNDNIAKLCMGHLLSPRFPSVKIIDNKQNSPTKFVPPINYKSSFKNLEEPENSAKRQNIVESRRNSMDFSSHKEISYRKNPYESDVSEYQKASQRQQKDGKPPQITIKGSKFYRNFVQTPKY